MMDNASGLFAGLHFDRKRFAKDLLLFEPKHKKERASALVHSDEAREQTQEELFCSRNGNGGAHPPASEAHTPASEAGGEAKRPKLDDVERIGILRKKHRIHVSSAKAPPPLEHFQDLSSRYGFSEEALATLNSLGLTTPTPIQRQAIPILLQGQECFACAPTGSGKTLAYALPILHSLLVPSKSGIRSLILSPTRELAAQIVREIKRITPPRKVRVRLLTKAAARCNDLLSAPGCDVLVATPLRLNSLLGPQPKIDLSLVKYLVLDEADKLFELGFVEQIDAVVAACTNPEIVRSLFSATLPETVEQLARTIMHDPCRIVIGERNSAASSVKQELLFVGSEEGKLLAMKQLLQKGIEPPVLVFVQSKERAQKLYSELVLSQGVKGAGVIHADRTQKQRDTVVDEFRSGKVWLLIATDLLGRGMDFKGVNLVINYDFPTSSSSYIHRVGRSGRAGRSGRSVTFYTEEDKDSLRGIAHLIAASGTDVPSWMLELPKKRKQRVKHKLDSKKI